MERAQRGHETTPPTPLTEDELKLVLLHSHEEGVLTEGEAKIMIRAFEFADRQAGEILVAAEHVDFISLSRRLTNLRSSRLRPLPAGNPGNAYASICRCVYAWCAR